MNTKKDTSQLLEELLEAVNEVLQYASSMEENHANTDNRVKELHTRVDGIENRVAAIEAVLKTKRLRKR